MAEEKETKNPVQSAERIFQVMEMLAENGEMVEYGQPLFCIK